MYTGSLYLLIHAISCSVFSNDEMLKKTDERVYLIYMPQHTLHSRKLERGKHECTFLVATHCKYDEYMFTSNNILKQIEPWFDRTAFLKMITKNRCVSLRGYCIKDQPPPPFSHASQPPPPTPWENVAIYIFHAKDHF